MNHKLDGIVRDVEFPALENFYGKIYSTAEDCRYKFFDAILLTAERSPAEFIDAVIATDTMTDKILTFARKNSALESWLIENQKVFAQIFFLPAVNGSLYLVEKFAQKKFAAYVVTHKKISLDLPDGYKIIHAGHAQATETFGDLVDDAGENISRLNLYLNEVTALFWLWKHTHQSHVAFFALPQIFHGGREKHFVGGRGDRNSARI